MCGPLIARHNANLDRELLAWPMFFPPTFGLPMSLRDPFFTRGPQKHASAHARPVYDPREQNLAPAGSIS
jgi:hypothetical protein